MDDRIDRLNRRLLAGIEQAMAGDTVDRGDFSRYLEDDEESWCTDEPVQPDWIVVQASIDDDE